MLVVECLKAQLSLLLPYAERHVPGWTAEQAGRISARQLTRRLAPLKKQGCRQSNCATQHSRMLRHTVEVSTARLRDAVLSCWRLTRSPTTTPACAAPLSGPSTRSMWPPAGRARPPVLGNGIAHVVPALEERIARMLFPVHELHSDNGSEFINYHLVRYCQEHRLRLTHERPNRKDDSARIEQKNWTQVRQVIGYHRQQNQAELRRMRSVYPTPETLTNLFEPRAKMVDKTRTDASVHRRYDQPMTPLDRVIAHYRGRHLDSTHTAVE